MKEFLLNLLSSSLETIGETKLVEVLQKLHDKNPAQYKVAILGGLQLVLALEPIVISTGTKIDNSCYSKYKPFYGRVFCFVFVSYFIGLFIYYGVGNTYNSVND